MLSIKNLTVKINDKTILHDFNLDINDGEIVTLMGPNGVGKSTICKVIMGDPTYEVINGSIFYNNIDLLSLSTDERSRQGIFLLAQNPIELEGITNAEVLRRALECKTGEHVNIFDFNKKITHICEKLNIPVEFIHRGVNEGMSGGEKKKNEILHLYVLEPKLILLDELDSGLDVDSLKSLSASLMDYKDETVSILIITHHTNILEYIKPDKVSILSGGSIVKEGDASLAREIETSGFSAYEVSEK